MNGDTRTFSRVAGFVSKQQMLDVNQTLAQLSERIGDRGGDVAGYVFAWDKYVYDVGDIASKAVSFGGRRAEAVLDLNTRLSDVMQLAAATEVDQLAGYIYTEDKKTFIVGSLAEEGLSIDPPDFRR